jgi:hypothetical protein
MSGLIDVSLAGATNLHTHGIIPKGATW